MRISVLRTLDHYLMRYWSGMYQTISEITLNLSACTKNSLLTPSLHRIEFSCIVCEISFWRLETRPLRWWPSVLVLILWRSCMWGWKLAVKCSDGLQWVESWKLSSEKGAVKQPKLFLVWVCSQHVKISQRTSLAHGTETKK